MFYSKLRNAIAELFPDRYQRHRWRNLLPDFVDVHLKGLTIQWARHQHSSQAPQPTMPPELPAAISQLARQQKLSYDFLALSHFVQLHQTGYLTAQHQRLSELTQTSLTELFASQTPRPDADPVYNQLLRTILLQLAGPDGQQMDNQTLLTSFIQQQFESYQQQLNDYEEGWADHQNPQRPHDPPKPAQELVAAVILQALDNQQTYSQLAFELFEARQMIRLMEQSSEFQSELTGKMRTAAQLNYQAARMYEQGIDLDNRHN
ncbi:hypothetical protein [Spirosoma koreense]